MNKYFFFRTNPIIINTIQSLSKVMYAIKIYIHNNNSSNGRITRSSNSTGAPGVEGENTQMGQSYYSTLNTFNVYLIHIQCKNATLIILLSYHLPILNKLI